MKYVLLDTNIFIDMVVDRNNKVSGILLELFIKLLNYNEIKLVVPQIVKVETYRHLEDELEKVGKNIQTVIKNIKALYGINAYKIDGLDIQEYKKESTKQLNIAKEMFENNKGDYEKELTNIMELLFDHGNCILVEDDDFLNNAVLKRRIYKRAPFHIEAKESFADGLIAETLIHIKNYIQIETDDDIIFVTRNYKDFSHSSSKKEELHPDIIEDLQREGVENLTYIGEFGRLIQEVLKENVENANLEEEFEKEMAVAEAEQEEQIRLDYEDLYRESVGLSALSSFEDNFENAFFDSKFHDQMVALFSQLRTEYGKLEENSGYYEEDISYYVRSQRLAELPTILKIADEFCGCLEDSVDPEFKVSEIEEFLFWIDKQDKLVNHEFWEERIQYSIEFGDKIKIYDCNKKKYTFELDALNLSPVDGSTDQIGMRIRNDQEVILAKGFIDITYGFIEEDEDGGVGDGCKEDVIYQTQAIIEFLENMINEWEIFNQEQIETIEQLRAAFSL